MRVEKVSPLAKQIDELLRQDEFKEHKCLYELHAATWQVARSRGDAVLLRKSAKQMLFHLERMYKLTKLTHTAKPCTHSASSFSESGLSCARN